MLNSRVETDHQVEISSMVDYLMRLLSSKKLGEIVTELEEARRNGQLSLKLFQLRENDLEKIFLKNSMMCDVRHDGLLHITVNPYTTRREINKFVNSLERILYHNIEISVVKANDFLANWNDMAELITLTDLAFRMHNPNIHSAFLAIIDALSKAESQDEKALLEAKRDEFIALSREVMIDSMHQIDKACTPTDPYGGIVIIARDLAPPGQPIVGIISGVRNGYEHPSHEYFGKVFKSQCGLAQALGSSFSPVIDHFEIEKLNAYKNVFMLGMFAVDPKYMEMNIGTEMVAELRKQLQAGKYDGLFSNITSPQAQGLLKKLRTQAAGEEDVSVQVLQTVGANSFFGIAFNDQGRQTFSDFNRKCRKNLSQVANIQQAGGSPLHSPRGERHVAEDHKSHQIVPK